MITLALLVLNMFGFFNQTNNQQNSNTVSLLWAKAPWSYTGSPAPPAANREEGGARRSPRVPQRPPRGSCCTAALDRPNKPSP